MKRQFVVIIDTDQLAEMSDNALLDAWWAPQTMASADDESFEGTAELVARVEQEIVRRWLATQGFPFRHRIGEKLRDKLAQVRRDGVRKHTSGGEA